MELLLRRRRRADWSDQRGIGVDAQSVPSGGGGGGGGSPVSTHSVWGIWGEAVWHQLPVLMMCTAWGRYYLSWSLASWGDSSTNEWLDQVLPHINVYKKDMLAKIVDPSLIVDEDLLQEVWAMAIMAMSCLNPKPSKRLLTRYVLQDLENPLKILREDTNTSGSARLRNNSSSGSWTAAFVGSWRHSSSDMVAPGPPSMTREGSNSRQGRRTGSQGSGSKSGDFSSSRKRFSREIFPEPANEGKGGEKSEDGNFQP